MGTVPSRQPGQKGPPLNRCFPCRMNILRDRKKVTKSYVMKRHEKLKGIVRCVTRKNIRLKLKVILHDTCISNVYYNITSYDYNILLL